ncbi:MAG: MBL fold metallo-hydrolase [Methanomassiliicoccales archaeon]|nr:MBL fold metallo-hydrolase [Methanomassiliicoccales archaeon]
MTASFASFSAGGHPDRIERFGLFASSDHFTAYFVLTDRGGKDVATAGTVDFEIRDEFMITLYKASFEVTANEFSTYDLPDHTLIHGYVWQIPFAVIQKSDSRNESLMAYIRFSNNEIVLEKGCDNVPFPDVLKAPNKPPVLKLNAPKISWCDIVTKFNASSSYDPNLNAMFFRWNFGDGQNVTGSSVVSHFYRFPGDYQVKLTVEDSEGGVSDVTHSIKIENPEVISITKKRFENQNGTPSMQTLWINISLSNRAPQPISINISEFFVKTDDDELYQCEETEYELDRVLDPLKRISISLHFDIPNNRMPSVLIYKDRVFVPIDETIQENLTVSFVDVGQGDAVLIKTPDSKTVLIDAGPNERAAELINYLYSNKVTSIDAFILTHPDEDHIGGADEVLRNFDVLSIYHPGYVRETTTYSEFVSAMLEEGCPIITDENMDPGDRIPISGLVDFLVLHVDKDAPNSNSASIVIKMSYFEIDFLLTGDIGYDVEKELLVNFLAELDIEVLKVAHHGSKYSTSDEFLEATTPEIGIIMVGADNPYDHPSTETLARLSAHHVTVLRTDIEGTIAVTTDGIGLAFSFEKTSSIKQDFDDPSYVEFGSVKIFDTIDESISSHFAGDDLECARQENRLAEGLKGTSQKKCMMIAISRQWLGQIFLASA